MLYLNRYDFAASIISSNSLIIYEYLIFMIFLNVYSNKPKLVFENCVNPVKAINEIALIAKLSRNWCNRTYHKHQKKPIEKCVRLFMIKNEQKKVCF